MLCEIVRKLLKNRIEFGIEEKLSELNNMHDNINFSGLI